ncbi:GGDEF domain-containing protein [Planococcus sp. CAU13]|uniref:GGDEF domain-containing protein n=1 Tax=Planococcus sp. CAU13 TaxID=1541197 RepID=UPI00052FE8CA|nr:GGDEF domain-containing protein [Planococcus sp. CAU13]
MTYIGEIAQEIFCVSHDVPCGDVDQLFQENQGLQGFVVIAEDNSAGLITRTSFYQKMGTRYGYNLFLKRPIQLLANNSPLIVDYFASVIEVSKQAMDRPDEEVYDDVIIKKENTVFGTVSIKELLLKVADIQADVARYLNPLTLLPGNYIIDEKLENLFRHPNDFTFLYIDLDRFKPYNDLYGFRKGDEFLQSTATILKDCFPAPDCFIGHVGGDDFIVILNHFEFENYCNDVIRIFDDKVRYFYTEEHYANKTVLSENRAGEMEAIPLVSISIAVVKNDPGRFSSAEELVAEATRLKKICKMNSGSCYYIEPSFVS